MSSNIGWEANQSFYVNVLALLGLIPLAPYIITESVSFSFFCVTRT